MSEVRRDFKLCVTFLRRQEGVCAGRLILADLNCDGRCCGAYRSWRKKKGFRDILSEALRVSGVLLLQEFAQRSQSGSRASSHASGKRISHEMRRRIMTLEAEATVEFQFDACHDAGIVQILIGRKRVGEVIPRMRCLQARE